ncbi:ShlB/FhaC/HecB family hemolysin secretion/activation protein [Pandoraea iniqua]|uniref:ShlB/FhaC/HecB family hemolysin secretion/activation protein n=1 Tax=Pandoraea iniqua TaxID=2508288 RepID=UPI0015823DF6|nr:ShlB/FhaC/HecB family hemolysin secretion/activation protein [Pandoraea iniqua]
MKLPDRPDSFLSRVAAAFVLALPLAANAAASAGAAVVAQPMQPVALPELRGLRDATRQGVQDQRLEQQRRETEERERRSDAPDVRLSPDAPVTPDTPPAPDAAQLTTLPAEAPCVVLRDIDVTSVDGTPVPASFTFLRSALTPFISQCAGAAGVAQIATFATDAVLSRGWLTTRVVVPEQDLTGGRLTLRLIPGVISAVRFSDPDTRTLWRAALPVSEGDVLSLAALEQGLEQLKRMPSQDADIRIEPGELPGTSVLVIDTQRRRAWRLLASVDNSGTRDTGRLQGQLALGIDNVLGLNDLLDVAVQHDLSTGDDRFGAKGGSLSYSFPWGYNTVSLFGSTRAYFQRIAGANQTFVSSGRNQIAELKIERVVQRDRNGKTALDVRLGRRFGKSFIEDFEISQQYRNNTYLQIGVARRQYLGAAQADIMLGYRQGMPWFGAQDDLRDPVTQRPTPQTYRYHVVLLDAQWSVPLPALPALPAFPALSLGPTPLRYVGVFHAQTTANALWAVDQIAIGGRYSLRGFTGDYTLSASRGFFLRNEIHLPIGTSAHALYVGIDYGQVFGPGTRDLPGTQLAGAVIGARGQFGANAGAFVNASYDVFLAKPLYRPAGFPVSSVVAGFSLALRY